MSNTSNSPEALWRAIEQVGSVDGYIQQQLRDRGFLVEPNETDRMSAREKEQYKKALKAEAAERKKIAREAWEAYRSSHIVFLGERVFWNDLHDRDRFDVENAEERVAAFELPPLDTPHQLAEALSISVADLRWFAYHREAARMIHYTPFTIPKRSGGERTIWAPMPRLKKIQRWILRQIVEPLPVHGAAHGFLPGRSIATNAAEHCDSSLIVRIDLRDFFPSVNFRRVKGVFRKAGYREQIATLLALLCTEAPRKEVVHDGRTYLIALGDRCLPQGAPTSPGITNVLCRVMDRRLTGLANKLGYRYTRYADDLTFSRPNGNSSSDRLGGLFATVRQIVEHEGFAVHEDKTSVSRRGSRQRVTGLVVNGEKGPRVGRAYRRELRAALHKLELGEKPKESLSELEGKIAYLSMTDRERGAAMMARFRELTNVEATPST